MQTTDSTALDGTDRAALSLVAAWMGERFYRSFRIATEDTDDPTPFDATLMQRERRVGVTLARLWEDDGLAASGASELERLVSADLDDGGGYVLWVPPGAALPLEEPARSQFRLTVTRGLGGLAPGERRELRIPAILRLAKIDTEGAYVSVTGGLAAHWTQISDRVPGAFHLDSRALHRLPEEAAELAIIVSLVRDRAAVLGTEEMSEIEVHDHWLVSRLPDGQPGGLTAVAAPATFDAADGAAARRSFRRAAARASEQRAASDLDFNVLVVIAALGHIEEELVTAALRGMSPAAYSATDLIVLVADGQVRQVLQPRKLPWQQ